jgi:hypothetical protein
MNDIALALGEILGPSMPRGALLEAKRDFGAMVNVRNTQNRRLTERAGAALLRHNLRGGFSCPCPASQLAAQ